MKNSETNRLENAIEAILLTMGESVEVSKNANAIGHDVETTKKLVHRLMDRYDDECRGIQIIELDNSFQMCSRKDYYPELVQIASQPKKHVLTVVLVETLSIIAYKQPKTRAEIEKIRGVKCDHAVNKLVEYELVMELGRLDAPGRPLLFGTSEEFLRQFGIKSLDDLPIINKEREEEFKLEAEEEAQLQLDV